jgi:hypothetical protein
MKLKFPFFPRAGAFLVFPLRRVLLICLAIYFIVFSTESTNAQCTTTVPSGSFIVNMGVVPQTMANGLKPYGLIYDLITNYGVPILWCIDQAKIKDGPDFTYNAVNYSGGTFVVPGQYITAAVATRISFWQGIGVQGLYANAGVLAPPVYDTITAFPKVMIDNGSGNQNIITGYYTNAGIPSSGYVLGIPSSLNGCYDIWTNPHDDPTWTSHGYLHNFVTNFKGNIFAECHEVSVMENVKNPASPFQQLNFLSTTGLQCYQNAKCGAAVAHAGNPTLPATYSNPGDPIMQFMGSLTGATQAGSEKWYIPLAGGQWYGTTKRSVRTANGASPAEGVLLVYGPAYGNPANGTVMYEAGHDLNSAGTAAEKVSAQRAYFNFVLYTGKQKRLAVNATVPSSFGSFYSYPLSAAVTSGTAPYTYQWSSLLGASIANASTANATYTAPNVAADTMDQIKIRVTDACGRVNFQIICVPLLASPLPIELLSFTAERNGEKVETKWSTATEVNNDYFSVERSKDAFSFQPIGIVDGAGNSSWTREYAFNDVNPIHGLSYYRLKQTDFDGHFSYSQIVPIRFDGNEIVVYPNPSHGKITILSEKAIRQSLTLKLIDVTGRLIEERNLDFTDEQKSYELLTSDYAKGVYSLSLTGANFSFIRTVVLD